jgi:hypothetical protein
MWYYCAVTGESKEIVFTSGATEKIMGHFFGQKNHILVVEILTPIGNLNFFSIIQIFFCPMFASIMTENGTFFRTKKS